MQVSILAVIHNNLAMVWTVVQCVFRVGELDCSHVRKYVCPLMFDVRCNIYNRTIPGFFFVFPRKPRRIRQHAKGNHSRQ